MNARQPVIKRPTRPHPGPPRSKGPVALRRVVTFVILVSVSVGSLALFSDDPVPVRGSSRSDIPDNPGVTTGQAETTVVLGSMDFDITGVFEVAPGVFERRVEYVVRFEEGRPEDDGFFRLKEPQITVMNPMTESFRGEVSAREGRCRTNQSSAMSVNLSTSNVSVEAFSLSGEVRGRYLMDDGSEVTLRAEQLDQVGDRLEATGLVVWERQGVSLAGRDMLWNQSTGRLEFASDTVITMTSPDGGFSGTLRGAGGLVWEQRPEAGGLGFGSLRGPVNGELADGSTLSADHLALDGDATALTLTGRALLEQVLPRGVRRASAEHITVAQNEAGEVSLAHAQGNVRLEQTSPNAETRWLEASSLTEISGLVSAPGLVRWGRGALAFEGQDLTLDEETNQLRYGSDVTMEIPLEAPSSLAGMTFSSPGGMVWLLPKQATDPWAEALGRFTGEVSGRTPNGLAFRCDNLEHDGPGGLLVLSGNVQATAQDPHGRQRTLDTQHLDLALDQGNNPVDLSARGGVKIRWSGLPAQGLPATTGWTLDAAQLRVVGERVMVPGSVEIIQGLFSLTGVGLEYDGAQSHFELEHTVVVRLVDGSVIRSPRGLVWDQPADPGLGIDQGQGTLRGPATGENPRGLTFRSDVIEIDGARQLISLVGDARVNLPGERVINSQRLDLQASGAGRAIRSKDRVSWKGPLTGGNGIGLSYDTTKRLLTFDRDVSITFLDLMGDVQLELSSAGTLSWAGPRDDTLPLWLGSGRIQDQVTAITSAGQRFTTDLLLLDGSSGRFDLIGPSRVALPQIGGLGDLSAQERITLLQNVGGEIVWLDAYGEVSGTIGSESEAFEYEAEALVFDRDGAVVVLDGESRIERVRAGKAVGLSGDARTQLVALVDETGMLTSLVGKGRITSNLGSFTILSDSLDWDVPEDHMVLTGNCRVLRFGGEVETAMVEIWPRAWRWHIHPPAASDPHGR